MTSLSDKEVEVTAQEATTKTKKKVSLAPNQPRTTRLKEPNKKN